MYSPRTISSSRPTNINVCKTAVTCNKWTQTPNALADAQEEESAAAKEVAKTEAPLKETRIRHHAALEKLREEDDEASVALHAAYLAASKEAKQLLRKGAPPADYAKKAAEVKSLATDLDLLRAADAAFREEVLKLESTWATQGAAHHAAVEALTHAQAKVAQARQQSLRLSTPSPIQNATMLDAETQT